MSAPGSSRTGGIFYLVAGRFGWLMLQLVSVAVYFAVLGNEAYGVAVAVALYRGYMKLIDLEILSGSIQRLSMTFPVDPERAWRFFRTTLSLQGVVALVGGFLLLLGASFFPMSAVTRAHPQIGLMFAFAALQHVSDTISSTLSLPYMAREQFKRLAFFESVLPVGGTLLIVALVVVLRSPLALMVGTAAESLVGLGFKVALVRRYEPRGVLIPRYESALAREILGVGWRVYLTNLSAKIGSTADRLIIENMLGPGPLAIYNTACRIPQVVLETLGRLSEAITPNMVAVAEHEPARFSELLRRNTLIVTTLASVGIVALGGLGTPLLQTWMRASAPIGGPIVLLMALYYGMEQHFSTYTRGFFAKNRLLWMLPFTIWNTTITLLLTAPVAKAYGLSGVAAMNVFIDLVQFVPITWITVRMIAPELAFRPLLVRTAAILGVGFGSALPFFLITRNVAPKWPSAIWSLAAAVPCLLALAILVGTGLGLIPNAVWRRLPSGLRRFAPA